MKRTVLIGLSILLLLSLSVPSLSKTYKGKKVLFIDSYHEGYAWSDGITRGVKKTLEGKGVELKVIHMDTKRNKDNAFKEQAALKAKAVIEKFKPDVVIAADDNASKYLIKPYYKDSALPFVFCGVNWDASGYGFPCSNVTGMVEVNDVMGLINQLKQFAKGDRIGFIAGETLTNHKEIENYKKAFNLDVIPYFAENFEDWKKGFTELQVKVDAVIVYNYVAVDGWNKTEAEQFVQKNTKVPTGTMQAGPMDYALVGFLKIPEEQGKWASEAALKILDGKKPSEIPVAQNSQGKLMFNMKIAQGLGIQIPYDMVESADAIIE